MEELNKWQKVQDKKALFFKHYLKNSNYLDFKKRWKKLFRKQKRYQKKIIY
jgi:hypothetical protein